MKIERTYIHLILALILGFIVGVYYSKTTGASLVLASLPGSSTPLGTNGTASIPIYGMVTAAEGVSNANA